jgi:hypothetical protein
MSFFDWLISIDDNWLQPVGQHVENAIVFTTEQIGAGAGAALGTMAAGGATPAGNVGGALGLGIGQELGRMTGEGINQTIHSTMHKLADFVHEWGQDDSFTITPITSVPSPRPEAPFRLPDIELEHLGEGF